MLRQPFAVIEPEQDSPVVVEVPHAGLALDAESARWIITPVQCLAFDADLYVDELFAPSPGAGATLIYAHLSRHIIDLNMDHSQPAAERGADGEPAHRFVWRLTHGVSDPSREAVIPRGERERRRRAFFEPYHQALGAIIERQRRRFGLAVLLCAHSQWSEIDHRIGPAEPVADVTIGTRGRSTAADRWIDLVADTARQQGFSVSHDGSKRGGFSTGHYGRPAQGVHAVQIELARHLYLDLKTLRRLPEGFAQLASLARRLVQALVAEARRGAAEAT